MSRIGEKIFIVILALLLVFLLFYFFNKKRYKTICCNNFCFKVKIVDTLEKRRKGLMCVKNLPDNEGMLFVFSKTGYYGFWMKNTYLSLDIIWLDSQLKVTKIWYNARPCKKNCKIVYGTGKYVLEINGGIAGSLGIKTGFMFYFR